MKKSFLFIMLVVFLAGAGFGGISMAQSTETSTCEGEVKYGSSDTCASLSVAISNASDGDTITLLKNVNADVVIPGGRTIIINLGGHKLTNVENHTITNNGTLTIEGEGVIDNITHGKATIVNNKDAVLTINGGTIKRSLEAGSPNSANGNSYYTISNRGALEINGGYIENSGTFSSNVEIGYYNGCTNETPSLTINGGTFSGGKYTLKSDDCGKITINDGEFNGIYGTILAWNNVEINSGYFTNTHATNSIIYVSKYQASTYTTEGKVKINGGTFSGNNNIIGGYTNYLTGDAEMNGGLFTTAGTSIFDANVKVEYVVKGGIFSVDPDNAYIGDKCSIKNDDGNYEVKDCPTLTDTFLTSSGYEIPMVLEGNTIKLEETKSLLKKIPTTTTELTAILALDNVENKAEVLSIGEEKVLFINAKELGGTNTMAFRQKGSTLFNSTSFKDNKTNTDATKITYDLDNAIVPSWADKNEAVKSYNATTDNKGYTIHTKVNYSWFYAPRMYKVTFNSNGGTEYEAQIVALVDGKATNPGIPTKEGSGFKFWSLSNGENATEYDFSAEVTDDITLYAIYGDDAFTVTWKNGNDIINTGVFASGAMPAYVGDAPSKDADSTCNTYEFKEWTPSVTAVTDEATYTATFTCTSPKSSKSSGGGGGGGSSKVTNTEDTKATTGDTAKVDENNTEENNEEKANDENKDEEKSPMTDAQAVEKFGQEQIDAYKWALENGITTMKTVEEARLDQPLTRAELAKMMVVYIQKVLEKDPIVTGDVSYSDVDESLGDLYGYIKLAYQYQIMGINADGTPIKFFNPNGLVTRGEYATVFSRVLFGDKFNKAGEDFYTKHLEALKAAGILTNTIPTIQEMRGWVMLMMYRSSQNSEAIENVANTSETNEEEKTDEETATASDETKSEANEEENAEEATNTEATTGDLAETPATQESSETTAENTETTAEATTGNVAEAPTTEASTGNTASN